MLHFAVHTMPCFLAEYYLKTNSKSTQRRSALCYAASNWMYSYCEMSKTSVW